MYMVLSEEDAFRLLNKWKAEASEILAVLSGGKFGFSCNGRILSIEDSKIQIASPNSKLLLDLSGATYLYEDPREAPDRIRESMESKYVCELTAILPSGEKCGLFEKIAD
jgi:hypothetical protein